LNREVVVLVKVGTTEVNGDPTTHLPQLTECRLILDHKSLQQKGRVKPRSVQRRHEHPNRKLLNQDLRFHFLPAVSVTS
jgi:hypothetical protein